MFNATVFFVGLRCIDFIAVSIFQSSSLFLCIRPIQSNTIDRQPYMS